MKFYCIKQLEYSPDGVIAKYRSNFQLVSLQQGSVDGACGPYSIFMALMSIGIVNRKHIEDFFPEEKSDSLARFYKQLKRKPTLLTSGTSLKELDKLITTSFTNIKTDCSSNKNETLIKFITGHIQQNHPVVVGIRGENFAHWLLVIGYTYDEETDAAKYAKQFLCLDPGQPTSYLCLWNSILDFSSRQYRKKYPFKYYPNDDNILFEEAIAIWK